MVPQLHLKRPRDLLPLAIRPEEVRHCALEKHHLSENLTRHDQTVTAQTLLDQNCKELPPYKAENKSHENPTAQPDQTDRQYIKGDEQPGKSAGSRKQ
jgi:hypothetical protein